MKARLLFSLVAISTVFSCKVRRSDLSEGGDAGALRLAFENPLLYRDFNSSNPVVGDDVRSLNLMPHSSTHRTHRLLTSLVYESLATKINGQLIEQLATRWEYDPIVAGNAVPGLRVYLRENVKWQRRPVDNADVAFSAFDVIRTFMFIKDSNLADVLPYKKYLPEGFQIKPSIEDIKAGKAPKNIVEMTWTKPNTLIAERLLTIPILPDHILGTELIDNNSVGKAGLSLRKQMIGTGPYMFASAEPLNFSTNCFDKVSFFLNPYYWDAKPDRRSLEIFLSRSPRCTANGLGTYFDYGQMSVDPADGMAGAGTTMPQFLSEFYKENYQENPNGPQDFKEIPSTRYYTVKYNANKAFLGKAVRDALSYASNVPLMARTIFNGKAPLMPVPIIPGSPYYNPAVRHLPWGMLEATRKMESSALSDLDLPLSYDANSRLASMIANFLKTNWEQIRWRESNRERRITVRLIPLPTNELNASLVRQEYTVAVAEEFIKDIQPDLCLEIHDAQAVQAPEFSQMCAQIEQTGYTTQDVNPIAKYFELQNALVRANIQNYLFLVPAFAPTEEPSEVVLNDPFAPLKIIKPTRTRSLDNLICKENILIEDNKYTGKVSNSNLVAIFNQTKNKLVDGDYTKTLKDCEEILSYSRTGLTCKSEVYQKSITDYPVVKASLYDFMTESPVDPNADSNLRSCLERLREADANYQPR